MEVFFRIINKLATRLSFLLSVIVGDKNVFYFPLLLVTKMSIYIATHTLEDIFVTKIV